MANPIDKAVTRVAEIEAEVARLKAEIDRQRGLLNELVVALNRERWAGLRSREAHA